MKIYLIDEEQSDLLSFWKELSSRVLLKDKIHKSVVADKFGYGEHDILDYCKSARGIYN